MHERISAGDARPDHEKEANVRNLVSEAAPKYGKGKAPAGDPCLASEQATERSYADLASHLKYLLDGSGTATKTALAVWDSENNVWTRRPDGSPDEAASLLLASDLPLTVLDYAAKVGEAVLLTDPTADPRFAQDPYFNATEKHSLAAVPVSQDGLIRAILLFETTSPDTFTKTKLRAVSAISAQLQSLFEHAGLCQQLQTNLKEHAILLEEARSQLAAQASSVSMAEVAADALHNVANLLTSVNTSIHVMSIKVRTLPAYRLSELANLLNDPAMDLKTFFDSGGKGRLIPSYLGDLAQMLTLERDQIAAELRRMRASVDYITDIITVQQSHSRAGGMAEQLAICDLVDDAIRMQAPAMSRHGVRVLRDFETVAPVSLDKTRITQILVNLVQNATQAMGDAEGEHVMHISVRQETDCLCISVRDNGCGISAENLERMFSHGFTTKRNGHGFGLHSCAIAAREMGGNLTVHSEGGGKGATFTLRVPTAKY
jgi:signal transduction histidine kinase